jgi:hypothetical protein
MKRQPRSLVLSVALLLWGVPAATAPALANSIFQKVSSAAGSPRAFRGQTMHMTDSAFAFSQEIAGGNSGVQRQPIIWSGNKLQSLTMGSPTYRLTGFQVAGVYGDSSAFLNASYLLPNAPSAQPQNGLFWSSRQQLELIVGPGTILPGDDRIKFLVTTQVSSKGIAFAASTIKGHQGVYFLGRQGIERIVDETNLVAGVKLTEFRVSQISLSGKNMAFGGVFGSAAGRFGAVYAWRDGKLEQVVNAGSTIAVESRSPEATINGQQVGITAFPGQGQYEAAGVYIQSASGKPLTTIANNQTVFPDRRAANPNIRSSSNQLCVTSRYSVFFNQDESGRGMFIHDDRGLRKMIAVGDVLDGKVITDLHAAGHYCTSKGLGLAVEFEDEVAIYQVTPDLSPAP